MRCIKCDGETSVRNSRADGKTYAGGRASTPVRRSEVFRQRVCKKCGARFNTTERAITQMDIADRQIERLEAYWDEYRTKMERYFAGEPE
jgi:transcriptional regulator NrdR family protein